MRSGAEPPKPSVFCVDADPEIRDSLAFVLGEDFAVHCAGEPAQALARLDHMDGAAVVIAEMHLSGMAGVEFLQAVRERWPHTSRIALTGDPSGELAASAVNQGEVFRYLIKPCPLPVLSAAVAEGVAHNERRLAEARLLEETLRGSTEALADVLGITNPVAFHRTNRLRRHVLLLAQALGHTAGWELEAAATLCEIGYISTPPEVVARIYDGEDLHADSLFMASSAPSVTRRLIKHIPQLAGPSAIIEAASWPVARRAQIGGTRAEAAGILAVARGFENALRRHHNPAAAIDMLRRDPSMYESRMVDTLSSVAALPVRRPQPGKKPVRGDPTASGEAAGRIYAIQ